MILEEELAAIAKISPHFSDTICEAIDRIRAAESIVAKLPKTADNQPVIIGMDIYNFGGGSIQKWKVDSINEGDDFSRCYASKDKCLEFTNAENMKRGLHDIEMGNMHDHEDVKKELVP